MTNILQVKLLSKDARMPERNHKTDAGYDIFSAETVVLEPQEKAVIKTDVAVSIPEGYVGLLTSRSGVSSKTHLVIETGKIDAGYHGNLGINIKNDHEDDKMQTIFLRDIDNEKIFEKERHLYKLGSYRIEKRRTYSTVSYCTYLYARTKASEGIRECFRTWRKRLRK